jgi:hypothetical protein
MHSYKEMLKWEDYEFSNLNYDFSPQSAERKKQESTLGPERAKENTAEENLCATECSREEKQGRRLWPDYGIAIGVLTHSFLCT